MDVLPVIMPIIERLITAAVHQAAFLSDFPDTADISGEDHRGDQSLSDLLYLTGITTQEEVDESVCKAVTIVKSDRKKASSSTATLVMGLPSAFTRKAILEAEARSALTPAADFLCHGEMELDLEVNLSKEDCEFPLTEDEHLAFSKSGEGKGGKPVKCGSSKQRDKANSPRNRTPTWGLWGEGSDREDLKRPCSKSTPILAPPAKHIKRLPFLDLSSYAFDPVLYANALPLLKESDKRYNRDGTITFVTGSLPYPCASQHVPQRRRGAPHGQRHNGAAMGKVYAELPGAQPDPRRPALHQAAAHP
jgi:hypothetical protein